MQSITVVPATSLEFSFGCHLLGFFTEAAVYRAAGRRACGSSLETAIYDVTCGEFLADPEGYISTSYQGDLDELSDNVRECISE